MLAKLAISLLKTTAPAVRPPPLASAALPVSAALPKAAKWAKIAFERGVCSVISG